MADMVQINPTTYEIIEHNCPILAVANHYTSSVQLRNPITQKCVKNRSCETDYLQNRRRRSL